MASWPAPASRCGKGNRPNGVGLGRPSWAQATGLDWARRVGLTRLQTTGLLGGGIFPAQHMAGRDRGRSIGQASPRCGVGVVPGSWGLGRCGLGAANLPGPLIPGQLVVRLDSTPPPPPPAPPPPPHIHTSTRSHAHTPTRPPPPPSSVHHIASHRSHCRPASPTPSPTLHTQYAQRPSKIQTKAEPVIRPRPRQVGVDAGRLPAAPLCPGRLPRYATATADKTHPIPSATPRPGI